MRFAGLPSVSTAHGSNHAAGTMASSNTVSKKEYRNARRDRLWAAQQGLCHWCQVQMMHWNDLHSDPGKAIKYGIKSTELAGAKNINLKSMPLMLATIDHLRDRFDSTRQDRPLNREQRWVLACWKCNHDRGRAREAEQSIEVLRDRAQRHKRAPA